MLYEAVSMVKRERVIIISILNLTQLAPSGSFPFILFRRSGQITINLIVVHLNTLLQ